MSLDNGDSAFYFAESKAGRLVFQKCNNCGTVQFPPRCQCKSCWSGEVQWIESAGSGVVEAFTIVRRAPLPTFRDKVPYVVASIVVEEGPRMIANIVGDGALEVSIGDDVTVAFETMPSGDMLPVFSRA